MTNVIEIKNLLICRARNSSEAHLRLPRKPLLVIWEANPNRSIGVAIVKKREGRYYADLTFSPVVEIKKINTDELFPSLILQEKEIEQQFDDGTSVVVGKENCIVALALGIYPNLDEKIKRIGEQMMEYEPYRPDKRDRVSIRNYKPKTK